MGNKQKVFGQQQIPSDETKSARGLSDPARSSKQYKSWIEVRLRCHCECLSCKQAGQLSFPHGVAKSDQGLDMGIEPHQATANHIYRTCWLSTQVHQLISQQWFGTPWNVTEWLGHTAEMQIWATLHRASMLRKVLYIMFYCLILFDRFKWSRIRFEIACDE